MSRTMSRRFCGIAVGRRKRSVGQIGGHAPSNDTLLGALVGGSLPPEVGRGRAHYNINQIRNIEMVYISIAVVSISA